jgi:hypothetical protein
MTLKLRPSLRQKQADCLHEIRPIQAKLEKAAQKLEKLQQRVDQLNKQIATKPDMASLPAVEYTFHNHKLAKITEEAAQLEFSKKVTEYFWTLSGSKDRLARELYPNNQAEQEAFIAEIDAALALVEDPKPSEKRSAPESSIIEDQPLKKARTTGA